MMPLVRNDWLWRTGLAGAIPSALLHGAGGHLSVRRRRGGFSTAPLAAAAAAAVFLLNPNILYLGSIPMTEPVLFASLFALLYFTVRFARHAGLGRAVGAGVAACAGTLTRYEGWFLLPFVAAYIWMKGARQALDRAAVVLR